MAELENDAWREIDVDSDDPRERVEAGLRAIDLGAPAEMMRAVVWPALVTAHDAFGPAAVELAREAGARPDRPDLLWPCAQPMLGAECGSLMLPHFEAALAREFDAELAGQMWSILKLSNREERRRVALVRTMVAHAPEDGDLKRELAWCLLRDHQPSQALEALELAGDDQPMDAELRRIAAQLEGDAEGEARWRATVREETDVPSEYVGNAMAQWHHDRHEWAWVHDWVGTMTCPPADSNDEALEEYADLMRMYGRGEEAVARMRATWGDEIPDAVVIDIARMYKQYDADYAAIALKRAYSSVGGPADVAVIKYDEAVLSGDWDTAEEIARKNDRMLLWLADMSPDLEQRRRALALAGEVQYRDRTHATSAFGHAMAAGDLAKAREIAREIDEQYADGDSGPERLALVDMLEGNLDMALANLTEARRREPDCTFSLLVGSAIHAIRDEWDRAVELAQRHHAARDPFYEVDVDQIVMEADRGGELLEDLISWHRSISFDEPWDKLYEVARTRAAQVRDSQ